MIKLNNNDELTKTEKIIISLFVVFGLSALYAVFAYIVMFIFSVLFGMPNTIIAQFIPMFLLSLFSIKDLVTSFKDDDDKYDTKED